MAGHRLIVIAGPSCAGKTPLWKTLQRRHPDLTQTMTELIVYNDRAPRPDEKDGEDYHFRDRETIERLRDDDDYVVCDVRGDLQAVRISEQLDKLQRCDVVYEGNPMLGRQLLEHDAFSDVERIGIFVSPVSSTELAELAEQGTNAPRSAVTQLMRRRLMRRAMRKYDMLELPRLRNIEKRAASAYDELRLALHFDHTLVNHDGEDSDHWELTGVVLGSARRAVADLAALLQGERPSRWVERWTGTTVPSD